MGMLVASPQMAENTMNKQIDVTKVLTSPKRRPIHPVSGCMTAAASMYELTAHVPSELLTPRLPDIDGTDTLTVVMSSISMKDAVAIAAVRNKSLPPRRGGYSNAASAMLVLGAEVAAHHGVRLRVRFFEILHVDLSIADGLLSLHRQNGSVTRRGVDRDRRGQSDAQWRFREIGLVDLNSYRHALHDLDPIARCILSR